MIKKQCRLAIINLILILSLIPFCYGFTGDVVEIRDGSNFLELHEPLGNVKPTITSNDLGILSSGNFSNIHGTSQYNQFLYLQNNADQYVDFTADEDGDEADYLYIKEGARIFSYAAQFNSGIESGIAGETLEDFEDEKLTILGKEYHIRDTIRHEEGDISIELMGGSLADTLEEGQTKTYTINGEEYEVTLLIVSESDFAVKIKINGEVSDRLYEGDIAAVGGIEIGITTVLDGEEGDVTGDVVEFFLGDISTITLSDPVITSSAWTGKLKVDGNDVDNCFVDITGDDDGDRVTISQIFIKADAGEDLYIGDGETVSENVDNPKIFFTGSFDIGYEGLEAASFSSIYLPSEGGGKQYELEFKNINGVEYEVPILTVRGSGDNVVGSYNYLTNIYEEMRGDVSFEFPIFKGDIFILNHNSPAGTPQSGETRIFRYAGQDADNNVLTFEDIGTNEVIRVGYNNTDTADDASIIIGGAKFAIDISGDINDSNISVDLDGDGSIDVFEAPYIMTESNAYISLNSEPLFTDHINSPLMQLHAIVDSDDINSAQQEEVLKIYLEVINGTYLDVGITSTYAQDIEQSNSYPVSVLDGYKKGFTPMENITPESEMTTYGIKVTREFEENGADSLEMLVPETQTEAVVYIGETSPTGVITPPHIPPAIPGSPNPNPDFATIATTINTFLENYTVYIIVGDTAPASDVIAAVEIAESFNNAGNQNIIIKLASEIEDSEAVNSVSVGRPHNNAVNEKYISKWAWPLGDNTAVIKRFVHNNTATLIVAGNTDYDTRAASNVLVNFDDYNLNGTCVGVNTTDFNNPSLIPCPDLTPKSKLAFTDIDVRVDSTWQNDLEEGDRIEDVKPGSEVEFRISLENLFDEDGISIEDIEASVTINSIDNNDDLEWEDDIDELEPQQGIVLNPIFSISYTAEEDDYEVEISAEGEDENGDWHNAEMNLLLRLEKDAHSIKISRAELSQEVYGKSFQLDIEIINIGRSDEENTVLEITSNELGINERIENISLEEGGDEDSIFDYKLSRDNLDLEPGNYPITIKAYYDYNVLSDEKTVNFSVMNCSYPPEIVYTSALPEEGIFKGDIIGFEAGASQACHQNLTFTWYVDGQETEPFNPMIQEDIGEFAFLGSMGDKEGNEAYIFGAFYGEEGDNDEGDIQAYYIIFDKEERQELIEDMLNEARYEAGGLMTSYNGNNIYYLVEPDNTDQNYAIWLHDDVIIFVSTEEDIFNEVLDAYLEKYPSTLPWQEDTEEGIEVSGKTMGPANAPVEIIEYGDFECPYCASFANNVLPNIMNDYIANDKVRFEFRHFPFDFHQHAQKAALAAECANEQGSFWEYHDLLFENQNSLEDENLTSYAQELGLNVTQFQECLDESRYNNTINQEKQLGESEGVIGTPTFFINDVKVEGAQPYNNFKEIIDAELGEHVKEDGYKDAPVYFSDIKINSIDAEYSFSWPILVRNDDSFDIKATLKADNDYEDIWVNATLANYSVIEGPFDVEGGEYNKVELEFDALQGIEGQNILTIKLLNESGVITKENILLYVAERSDISIEYDIKYDEEVIAGETLEMGIEIQNDGNSSVDDIRVLAVIPGLGGVHDEADFDGLEPGEEDDAWLSLPIPEICADDDYQTVIINIYVGDKLVAQVDESIEILECEEPTVPAESQVSFFAYFANELGEHDIKVVVSNEAGSAEHTWNFTVIPTFDDNVSSALEEAFNSSSFDSLDNANICVIVRDENQPHTDPTSYHSFDIAIANGILNITKSSSRYCDEGNEDFVFSFASYDAFIAQKSELNLASFMAHGSGDRYDILPSKIVLEGGEINKSAEAEQRYCPFIRAHLNRLEMLLYSLTECMANSPPVISYTPLHNPIITEDGSQAFSITKSDADGDNLTTQWYLNDVLVSDAGSYTYTATAPGTFTVKVNVTDILNASVSHSWTLKASQYPVADNFDGSTTAFSLMNETQLGNATNVVIEKASYGKIDFGGSVLDLRNVADINNNIIIQNNFVAINTNALPALNKPAKITMRGLAYAETPIIYYNSGFSLSGSTECPSSICSNINYDAGILTFDVAHFSAFWTNSIIRSKLEISNVEATIDGKSDNSISDGDKISKNAAPGSKIEFEIELKNTGSYDMEDIELEVVIEDIDDGDDIDGSKDGIDIGAGDDKTIKLELEVPYLVDDEAYDVIITAEGVDENNTKHAAEWNLKLDVDKEKHSIKILSADIRPSTISCSRLATIGASIINMGEEDEIARLEVVNEELGLSIAEKSIALKSGNDDDSKSSRTAELSISEMAKAGTYDIILNLYYDDNKLADSRTVQLAVADCNELKSAAETVSLKSPAAPAISYTYPQQTATPAVSVSFTDSSEYITLMIILNIIFLGLVIYVAMYVFVRR